MTQKASSVVSIAYLMPLRLLGAPLPAVRRASSSASAMGTESEQGAGKRVVDKLPHCIARPRALLSNKAVSGSPKAMHAPARLS